MRKKQRKDYSVYLRKSGVKAKDGKLAYISRENHSRISMIVNVLGEGRLTIADYLENVLAEHFRLQREEINRMLDEAPRMRL
ncbi:DUF3408 domain-containing protein [Bacteroides uniformis]|jgi:hypothetical protein B2_21071|uniref:DUF3408 domain-containing protein n=1 Tax=Bacteroides uniformis TaxID=820 RepID=UPI002166AA01|nr:DUF3408 domain-containing protein [Bacteroides uniformis]MCS3352803.1 DUF3408 domain-containing protein [Bacteroides uniformis]